MTEHRKGLGMGLDLLLKASHVNPVPNPHPDYAVEAKSLLQSGLDNDEQGNSLEAYYYYRRIIDVYFGLLSESQEVSKILSQACNNAATILFEAGIHQMAGEYLKKAVAVWPDNEVARENLRLIAEEE